MTEQGDGVKTQWNLQVVPVGSKITEFEVLLGGNTAPTVVVSIGGEKGVVTFDVAAGGHPDWTNPVRIFEDLREIAELGILAYAEEEETHG